jgi:outer membrane protein
MKSWFVVASFVALGPLLAAGASAADQVNLSLEKCVETALEVNTSVLKAGYDLDRSNYSVLSSASGLLPSAAWSTSYNRSRDGKSYGSAFSASERVSFGSVMGLYESLANKSATAENLRAVRHDVAYIAKQKYLEVLKSDRLLVVSEEALDLSRRRLEKAQAMLDVGSGVRSDVLRAQVEVSSNELDLISARNALRLAETDLRHFLAIPDERELVLEDILEAGEESVDLNQALAEAMTVRPDIRAGNHLVDASSRAVWGRRGGWVPSLQFSYSRDYSAPEDDPWLPERTLDLWDEAEWGYRMGVSVNIFDGLATFSQVKSAKTQLKAAREDLNQLERDASLEVTTACYNVEEARQRVKVSKETVSLAEEELRLAEERYRLGGGTMLEQIDAQVALSEARSSHIQALHDYLLSQAAMVRAVGRD